MSYLKYYFIWIVKNPLFKIIFKIFSLNITQLWSQFIQHAFQLRIQFTLPYQRRELNWIEISEMVRVAGSAPAFAWIKTTDEMYTEHVRESTRGCIIQAISMEWQGFYKVSIHRKILTSFLSGAGNLKTEYAGEPSIPFFSFSFSKRVVTGHNFDCISAAHPRQCASFPFLSLPPVSLSFFFFFSFLFRANPRPRHTPHTTILALFTMCRILM